MIVVVTVLENEETEGLTEVYRVPDDDGLAARLRLAERVRAIALYLMATGGGRAGVMLGCAPDEETSEETLARAVPA